MAATTVAHAAPAMPQLVVKGKMKIASSAVAELYIAALTRGFPVAEKTGLADDEIDLMTPQMISGPWAGSSPSQYSLRRASTAAGPTN